VSVDIGKRKRKKLTLIFFGRSIWAQSPTGSSSEVVGGEGTGRGVVVVVRWSWCSVDTAKTKTKKDSPIFFFTPYFCFARFACRRRRPGTLSTRRVVRGSPGGLVEAVQSVGCRQFFYRTFFFGSFQSVGCRGVWPRPL
jgi:hypothetical protein